MELRLADFNEATLVAKARLATAVPARPGRGMIGQNYERTGVDPVGLHTLMARPALESTAAEVFDSRSVAEAVSRQAVGFNPARKVRRLPGRVSPAELAAAAATDDRTPTSIVWALDETERPVFLASQHLIIAGQPKCGRTTACATLMREIRRVYAPGADGATGPGLEETADRPRPRCGSLIRAASYSTCWISPTCSVSPRRRTRSNSAWASWPRSLRRGCPATIYRSMTSAGATGRGRKSFDHRRF